MLRWSDDIMAGWVSFPLDGLQVRNCKGMDRISFFTWVLDTFYFVATRICGDRICLPELFSYAGIRKRRAGRANEVFLSAKVHVLQFFLFFVLFWGFILRLESNLGMPLSLLF
jgi:hypothetical protein